MKQTDADLGVLSPYGSFVFQSS